MPSLADRKQQKKDAKKAAKEKKKAEKEARRSGKRGSRRDSHDSVKAFTNLRSHTKITVMRIIIDFVLLFVDKKQNRSTGYVRRGSRPNPHPDDKGPKRGDR